MSINMDDVTQNKLFSAMSAEDIKRVLGCANPQVVEYQAEEIIVAQGEQLTYILVILSGEVNLFKEDYEGNRSLVGTLGKGDVYGQTAVFGDVNMNMLIVESETPCQIVKINKNMFYQPCSNVCPSHQMMIKNMLSLLANQANILDRKINYLTAKTLKCKIASFLLEESHANQDNMTFNIKLNREELAEYFDVQRPSLSRELIKMKEDGVIDYYKSTFKILDYHRLLEYSR